jgi:hypothetical protein
MFWVYSEPINNQTGPHMDISRYSPTAIQYKLDKLEKQAQEWAAAETAKWPNLPATQHWPFLCGSLTYELKALASGVLACLQPPKTNDSQIIYTWSTDCVELIECHLDVEPAEKGDNEMPSYPAQVTLVSAYLRGVDIYYLLSEDQISEIEEKALSQLEA